MTKTFAKAERKGDGFDYRLDPNRIRTEAEVATFADVFGLPVAEARNILLVSGCHCESDFNCCTEVHTFDSFICHANGDVS